MEETTNGSNKKKLKFNDSEYFLDDLPKEANQLLMGLRTADAQTKMYEDTLKLIALGKNKMVAELKIILDKIENFFWAKVSKTLIWFSRRIELI